MKQLFSLLFFALLIGACKKTTTTETVVINSNLSPGFISGVVLQYDQFGVQATSKLNQVTVSVEGQTYTTVTDTNGAYTLSNVLPGTYNVMFGKAGYGVWQQQQVSFAGNGTYFINGYVYQKPTYNFNTLSVKDTVIPKGAQRAIWLFGSITPALQNRGFLIISSKSNTLDITKPLSYDKLSTFSVPANASTFNLQFEYNPPQSTPVTTYYRIYPYPYGTSGTNYFSYALSKTVYPNFGPPYNQVFSSTSPTLQARP